VALATFLVQALSHGIARSKHVLLSTVEAEYIAVGSCCAQILWPKQQLANFGLQISKVSLMCDNTSAINLTKNQI